MLGEGDLVCRSGRWERSRRRQGREGRGERTTGRASVHLVRASNPKQIKERPLTDDELANPIIENPLIADPVGTLAEELNPNPTVAPPDPALDFLLALTHFNLKSPSFLISIPISCSTLMT